MFFHWLSDDIKFHHDVADHHRPSADSTEPAEREHKQTSLFLFPRGFLEKKCSFSKQSWFDYSFKASSRRHDYISCEEMVDKKKTFKHL